jgi:hypothetical protein
MEMRINEIRRAQLSEVWGEQLGASSSHISSAITGLVVQICFTNMHKNNA